MNAPAPASRKIRLPLQQTVKLIDWIKVNQEEALSKDNPEVARLASIALEFHVSASHVAGRLKAMGLVKSSPRAVARREAAARDAADTHSLPAAHHNIGVLARCLIDLRERGFFPPDDLPALKKMAEIQ